ncbi:MAG: ABC transporter transmembrane domain-containing protein [Sporichthyaceae bacterium]
MEIENALDPNDGADAAHEDSGEDAQDGAGRALLRATVAGQRRLVTAAGALFISHQANEALVPVIVGLVIDDAVSTGDGGALTGLLVLLAVVFTVLSFSYRYGARCAEKASEQAAHDLRLRLTRRILDSGGGAETGRLSGELSGLATSDTARVGMIAFAAPTALAAVAGLAVGGVALLLLSVPLGLLVLLGAPPLLWLVNLLGAPLEERSEQQQEKAAAAFGVAADLVGGLRVLKGIGAEGAAVARYRAISRDSLHATLRAARADAAYEGATVMMNGLFLALVALVGSQLAIRGHISVGELVAAVGLAQFLMGPLQTIGWFGAELAGGRASAGRIATVLDAAPAVIPGTAQLPAPIRGELLLAGVEIDALVGLDLTVAPGELLGVAADPAEAAALLRCLGREADPVTGRVELDGVAIGDLALTDLRRVLLVASHDADLFDGSLLENVRAGSPNGTGPLGPVLAAATADEVADALPAGAATRVGERGRALSGGQRQRVALARALAADPEVLVLHDPTTAVDAATEARIAEGIATLRHGRTTVLVTTSPVLLAAAHRVVLIIDGRAHAAGRHDELVAHERYRDLVLQ